MSRLSKYIFSLYVWQRARLPTSELWSTATKASMIGTIMAAVAPLEIHIETKAVVTFKNNFIFFKNWQICTTFARKNS